MIRNDYGVRTLKMYPSAKSYCPLGKDWYTNEFEVKMQVKDAIPDYCEVEAWLDENIRGKSLIVEEAVSKFRQYLETTYSPVTLEVTSSVCDALHFPVIVEA